MVILGWGDHQKRFARWIVFPYIRLWLVWMFCNVLNCFFFLTSSIIVACLHLSLQNQMQKSKVQGVKNNPTHLQIIYVYTMKGTSKLAQTETICSDTQCSAKNWEKTWSMKSVKHYSVTYKIQMVTLFTLKDEHKTQDRKFGVIWCSSSSTLLPPPSPSSISWAQTHSQRDHSP